MTPEEQAAADKKAAEAKAHDDLVKEELEKAARQRNFSEKEKAEYNLKKKAEEARALGLDPNSILGSPNDSKNDEEVPAWYRNEQAKLVQKSSLDMANSVADSDERALVIEYLTNRIKPSGDPDADFRLAFSAVRSLKNKQIIEDVNRRANPRSIAAGGSQPAKEDAAFEPTDTELSFMKHPYNLSKEKIIAARRRAEEKRK